VIYDLIKFPKAYLNPDPIALKQEEPSFDVLHARE
jgi:hypothetical protein